jgi:hypothetical protein
MKVAKRGTSFFNKVEYSKLKYKFLSNDDYKKFIRDVHQETVKEHVFNDKDGFKLPENLGYIRVVKYAFTLPSDSWIHALRKYSDERLQHGYTMKFIPFATAKHYTGLFNNERVIIKKKKMTNGIYDFKTHQSIKKQLTDITRLHTNKFHFLVPQ